MKIIKEGDANLLKEPITFTCDRCGCVFIADKTEYTVENSHSRGEYCYCKCPYCSCGTVKFQQ